MSSKPKRALPRVRPECSTLKSTLVVTLVSVKGMPRQSCCLSGVKVLSPYIFGAGATGKDPDLSHGLLYRRERKKAKMVNGIKKKTKKNAEHFNHFVEAGLKSTKVYSISDPRTVGKRANPDNCPSLRL